MIYAGDICIHSLVEYNDYMTKQFRYCYLPEALGRKRMERKLLEPEIGKASCIRLSHGYET